MLKVDLSTAAMCATFVLGLGPALAQPAGLQIEGGIFYAWPLRSEQGFGRRLACYMGSFALSFIFCSWARPLLGLGCVSSQTQFGFLGRSLGV